MELEAPTEGLTGGAKNDEKSSEAEKGEKDACKKRESFATSGGGALP